jgi:hypothetical protein
MARPFTPLTIASIQTQTKIAAKIAAACGGAGTFWAVLASTGTRAKLRLDAALYAFQDSCSS